MKECSPWDLLYVGVKGQVPIKDKCTYNTLSSICCGSTQYNTFYLAQVGQTHCRPIGRMGNNGFSWEEQYQPRTGVANQSETKRHIFYCVTAKSNMMRTHVHTHANTVTHTHTQFNQVHKQYVTIAFFFYYACCLVGLPAFFALNNPLHMAWFCCCHRKQFFHMGQSEQVDALILSELTSANPSVERPARHSAVVFLRLASVPRV